MKAELDDNHRFTAAALERDARGEILVGGKPLSRVVSAVGGTPCFLYDRERIARRTASLKRAFSPRVHLHYAVKANPMPALVHQLASLTDGLDVASAGELRTALDTGTPPSQISFAGPGKSERELAQALASGVLVHAESFRELRLLAKLSDVAGYPARVAVRVNLPFELRSSGVKMSGGPRQFGIDAECVPAAMREISALGLAFEGFHLFGGSQNLRADAIVEVHARSYALALEWSRASSSPVWMLNLGGGFGIPYTPSDAPLDSDAVTTHLNRLAERMAEDLPQAHLVIELGRYLVGEAGLYVCRVIDRKVSRGRVYLVVDGGMHHHLAASGNFGQAVRRNFPIAVNSARGPREVVSVVGPLCTPLDLLADSVELEHSEEGDLVVLLQSGAYGRSASPSAFLSHPDALEALV